jgi:diguanylate cyclase (GGDEF)-like protein
VTASQRYHSKLISGFLLYVLSSLVAFIGFFCILLAGGLSKGKAMLEINEFLQFMKAWPAFVGVSVFAGVLLIIGIWLLMYVSFFTTMSFSVTVGMGRRFSRFGVGVSVFFLIPFLWFTIGGVTGSTAPMMLTGGLCIALVFRGAVRTGMLVAEAIMLVAFVALEYHFPDIVIHYSSRSEHFGDMAFGLTMSFVANTILAFTVKEQYARVRDEKTRLVRRLERLSLTDALTGLYNRRFLSASIDEEMRLAYDTGSQLTLCILDIDHFKEVNDTYGHEYGDEVLFNIAQIMEASLTDGEIFGRYGGEEFVILFPGKTPAEALPTVRALGDHVRTHGWSHGKPVTLSGGLSSYVKGISYSNFVEAADKNLYIAKREGRDRIIYR